MTSGFESLVEAIVGGRTVDDQGLLPYLCQEGIRDRLSVNYRLAEAYFKAGRHTQAKVHIERAWIFSTFMEECLPLYIKIHEALNDIASIREAYKRVGMIKASENKIGEALSWFNSWHYADAVHRGTDSYRYDFDILNCISSLARPLSLPPRYTKMANNRKIRLAYLMFGLTQVNSVIVKQSLAFAQFHDKESFEVTFYVPEHESAISRSVEAKNTIRALEQFQCGVTVAPNSKSEEHSLIQLGSAIYQSDPDILVTSAALADFKHYFVAALRPAPLIVGLCQGPPPQFIAPAFDWSISWTKHPLMDCPTDCSLVPAAVTLPARQYSTAVAKAFMDIAEDSIVLMSCGRPTKFSDKNYLEAILQIVRLHPNVYFVAVGISNSEIMKGMITRDIAERVITLGWQQDYVRTLSMADVMIDTYPSGGGITILDAMGLGIPVVSFKNNYMQNFTQTDWNPAEEFMGVPELFVERGNMDQLKSIITHLITDNSFRRRISEECIEKIQITCGKPENMVRSCERVYSSLIRNKLNGHIASKDYRSIFPPRPSPPSIADRILNKTKRMYDRIFYSGAPPGPQQPG